MLTLLDRGLFSFVMLCLAWPVMASPPSRADVPENITGVTRLGAEGLIGVAARLPKLVVIDSRVHSDRHHGFIQGSVSLPDSQTSCATLSDFVATLDTPVLFYCNGVKCGRSVVAVNIARKCGYRQVYWFRGGFEEWKQKGYPFLKE